MKTSFCKQHNRFRIIIPPALTGTGKRQLRFFGTKAEADAEIRRITGRGGAAQPKITDTQQAALLLAQQLGLSEHGILDAVKHYQKTVDGRKTLSIAEVAKVLGFDTETIRRDAQTGAIPGAFQTKPGGQWRFRRSILEAWWAKQGIKGLRL